MLRTRPATSVVTSTPRIARKVPTAVVCGCHCWYSTLVAVTVVDGIGADAIWLWYFLKPYTLYPTTPATSNPIARSMINMRFFIAYFSVRVMRLAARPPQGGAYLFGTSPDAVFVASPGHQPPPSAWNSAAVSA